MTSLILEYVIFPLCCIRFLVVASIWLRHAAKAREEAREHEVAITRALDQAADRLLSGADIESIIKKSGRQSITEPSISYPCLITITYANDDSRSRGVMDFMAFKNASPNFFDYGEMRPYINMPQDVSDQIINGKWNVKSFISVRQIVHESESYRETPSSAISRGAPITSSGSSGYTDIGFIGLRRTGVRETRQFSGRKVMKPFSELNRTTVLVLYWGLFGGGGKLRHGKSGCQVAAGWFGALPDCWETQGWRAWQRPSGQPVGCWRNSGGVRAHFQ